MSKLLSFLILTFSLFHMPMAQAIEFSPSTTTARLDRQNRKRLNLHVEFLNTSVADLVSLGIPAGKFDDSAVVLLAFANFMNICVGNKTTPVPSACDDTATPIKPVLWNSPSRTIAPLQTNDETSAKEGESMKGAVAISQLSQDSTEALNRYDVKLDIIIERTDADYELGAEVKMRLFPSGHAGSGGTQKDSPQLKIELGKGVAVSPSLDKLASTKGTIILVVKDPEGQVDAEGGGKVTATGVQAVLIPNMVSGQPKPVPTELYEGTGTSECTALIDATDSSLCSVTCTADTINKLKLDDLPEGYVAKSTTNFPSERAINFADLPVSGDTDPPYAIVYSFTPEGTQFGCALGKPTDAATLLQLATGKEPKAGDPSCFIATAAYGSPLERHVRVLRWFRDTYLIPHDIGRAFVKLYYSYSPPAAQWIAERPLMRGIARAALWLPVMLIELWRDQPYLLALALLLPMLLLIKRRKTA